MEKQYHVLVIMVRDEFYLLSQEKRNLIIFDNLEKAAKFPETEHPIARSLNFIKSNTNFSFLPTTVTRKKLNEIIPLVLSYKEFGFVDGIKLNTELTRELLG